MANRKPLTDEQKKARRKKDKQNMKIVKPDQIGVCRYITAEIQQFELDPQTNKYIRTGSFTRVGLQYENHVIFNDGTFRNLNERSVRAVQIYQGEPVGVSNYLKSLYADWYFFDMRIVCKSGTAPYSESISDSGGVK